MSVMPPKNFMGGADAQYLSLGKSTLGSSDFAKSVGGSALPHVKSVGGKHRGGSVTKVVGGRRRRSSRSKSRRSKSRRRR